LPSSTVRCMCLTRWHDIKAGMRHRMAAAAARAVQAQANTRQWAPCLLCTSAHLSLHHRGAWLPGRAGPATVVSQLPFVAPGGLAGHRQLICCASVLLPSSTLPSALTLQLDCASSAMQTQAKQRLSCSTSRLMSVCMQHAGKAVLQDDDAIRSLEY
jgi:hypothetical protein